MFDYKSTGLPVIEIADELRQALSSAQAVVLSAPPGAGKSTVLPLLMIDEPWLAGRKIIMLEPRRLAAKAVAVRMAELLGEQAGYTVGYRMRFDTKISAATRVEVVTEGILTRMLQADNALEGYGLVIFDEFHERSLNADLALALCRDAQAVLRSDLRLLVMSATLQVEKVAALLKAVALSCSGRQYPVEIFFGDDADAMLLPEFAANTIVRALSAHEGDVLAFLPGEADIRKTADLLSNKTSASIHPLYGQLSQREQWAAIFPDRKRRKVVLATSIAETSLTIEGVSIVVDSGFAKTPRFDPRSGLSKLETARVSRDAADQRAGRAGRVANGYCYRMWTKATHERLADHRVPEILEADLTPLCLDLAVWGTDAQRLSWITPPPSAAMAQALDALTEIGALVSGKLTTHGRKIHRMACHPRIAHMLLSARDEQEKALACDIAALLEERDPLGRDAGVDLSLRVEALRKSRSVGTTGRFARLIKLAAYYAELCGVSPSDHAFDGKEVGFLLACAFPGRVASARPGNNAQFQLSNGKIGIISHTDSMAHEPWITVASMDLREGAGKIFLAAPVDPTDLTPLLVEREVVKWDTRRNGLHAVKELRLGSILLRTKPISEPGAEAVLEALLEVVENEGERLLDWSERFATLQSRIACVAKWQPDHAFPDISTPALLASAREWLVPYLHGIRTNEQLKRIDLYSAVFNALPFDVQKKLDDLAPEFVRVPSGSRIRISYSATAPPSMEVRIQELFGLADTPTVNGGRAAIAIRLLSPGYKPVQVTSDLRSFWNNMYPSVRNELKRRYPRHSWPEDPWKAQPVAKGPSAR